MKLGCVLLLLIPVTLGCGGSSSSSDQTQDQSTASGWGSPDPEPEPEPEPVAEPEPEPEPEPPPLISYEDAWQDLRAPDARWVRCEVDEDCTIVEIACCDHCNGGRVVSVVSRFAQQAERRYKPRRCNEACTERGCAAATPVCDEGQCAFIAEWMSGAPAEADEVEPVL